MAELRLSARPGFAVSRDSLLRLTESVAFLVTLLLTLDVADLLFPNEALDGDLGADLVANFGFAAGLDFVRVLVLVGFRAEIFPAIVSEPPCFILT